MSGPDPHKQAREAERWFDIAAEDLRLAQAAMDLDPPSYAGGTFHCQQAAEKIIKGLLVAGARRFTRTHDLTRLADQCVQDWPELRHELDLCRPLTQWIVEFRYPRPDDVAEPAPPLREIGRAAKGLARFLSAARAAVAARRRDPAATI